MQFINVINSFKTNIGHFINRLYPLQMNSDAQSDRSSNTTVEISTDDAANENRRRRTVLARRGRALLARPTVIRGPTERAVTRRHSRRGANAPNINTQLNVNAEIIIEAINSLQTNPIVTGSDGANQVNHNGIIVMDDTVGNEGCIDLTSEPDTFIVEPNADDGDVEFCCAIIREAPSADIEVTHVSRNRSRSPINRNVIEDDIEVIKHDPPITRAHVMPVACENVASDNQRLEQSPRIKCPICLDDEKGGTKHSLVSTVCGHVFHDGCLKMSMKSTSLCPKCRKKLTKKSFHPIYI